MAELQPDGTFVAINVFTVNGSAGGLSLDTIISGELGRGDSDDDDDGGGSGGGGGGSKGGSGGSKGGS